MTPGNRVFETFYTPQIMKFIFWLGCIVIFMGAISAVMPLYRYGATEEASVFIRRNSSAIYMFALMLYWIVGTMLWRVFCEVIIVIFYIHDRLVSIDEQGQVADQDAG